MKALIFAAGRGERLKPLTDSLPKPLVTINGKPLIQYHIEALVAAGINDIVINVSWLKDQIIEFINQLKNHNLLSNANINFSIENHPLETGGGMLQALPLLGSEPFVVVNADVYTDFNFGLLQSLENTQLVNLVLVKNPSHNLAGDFGLKNELLKLKSSQIDTYTYSGIGVYHPQILYPPFERNKFSIVPYIKAAIEKQNAKAQVHTGLWHDVGTLERLTELNHQG